MVPRRRKRRSRSFEVSSLLHSSYRSWHASLNETTEIRPRPRFPLLWRPRRTPSTYWTSNSKASKALPCRGASALRSSITSSLRRSRLRSSFMPDRREESLLPYLPPRLRVLFLYRADIRKVHVETVQASNDPSKLNCNPTN